MDNDAKPKTNLSLIIWLLSVITGFWFAKQIMIYREEKRTGIKKPMDKVDKIGWAIIAVFLFLFVIGFIIAVLVSIFNAL